MFKINKTTILLPDPITKIKEPYLTRYYLFGKDRSFGNIYIHQFHSGDKEDVLHNHPFKWSLSFILSGGYIEELKENTTTIKKTRFPFTFNFITENTFHKVSLLKKDCWTIFFAGPRKETWQFWDPKTNEFKDWSTSPNAIK